MDDILGQGPDLVEVKKVEMVRHLITVVNW